MYARAQEFRLHASPEAHELSDVLFDPKLFQDG